MTELHLRPDWLISFHRITHGESNILRWWEKMGRSAYLRREEVKRLRNENHLTPVSEGVCMTCTAGEMEVTFEWHTPGLEVLEIASA
jgi:hypothetical protein